MNNYAAQQTGLHAFQPPPHNPSQPNHRRPSQRADGASLYQTQNVKDGRQGAAFKFIKKF
jgi:hypothetical protein